MKKTRTPKKQVAILSPQPVVIQSCIASPDPLQLSATGTLYPDQAFFTTQDRDRVYEIKIKGGVFETKPGSFKLHTWFGHDSDVIKVDSSAPKQRFTYTIQALLGPACAKLINTPPTIIIES
jgi:hypothetical protein